MKYLRLTIATLVLPIALSAQTAPAAAPANPIVAAFKGRILASHRNIAQAFDSIPESKFSYKPTDKQLTIGYIAQHVASDSYLFCNTFGSMKATLTDRETSTPDSVKAKWSKQELVTQLKASFAFCAQAMEQLADPTLGETISLTFNGTTRPSTRINMVLGHALDLADHYSQLANYMRLNGMIPPSALPRPAAR